MKGKLLYLLMSLILLLLGSCEMAGDYLDGISDKITADQDTSDIPYDHGIILSITSAGPDYITLTWVEPSADDFSHVEISWLPGTEKSVIVDKGSNSYNMPSGGEDVVYEIRAMAVSKTGSRSTQNMISVRTPSYQRDVSCIYTVEELAAIDTNSTTMNGFYILRNNLSLSSYSSGGGWTSIGKNSGIPFYGIFDGNGHTITDLFINRSVSDQGLFGEVMSGMIENLNLENVDISGLHKTAALAGSTGAGTIIRNCNISGSVTGNEETGALVAYFSESEAYDCNTVVDVNGTRRVGTLFGSTQSGNVTNCSGSGTVNGQSEVGGFAGHLDGTVINNSHASVTVIGTDVNVGGFVGLMTSNVSITDSSSDSNVQGVGNVGGFVGDASQGVFTRCSASGTVTNSNNYTGGFAGAVYDSSITECRATGNVNAANGAGGFIGNHDDTSTESGLVIRSYATGSVSGADSVGGFVGDSNVTDYVDCYAMGDVSGVNNVGGFVGFDNLSDYLRLYSIGNVATSGTGSGFRGNSTGTYTNCYFNSDTSGYANDGDSGISPLTDIPMKNSGNYSGWDFTTVWATGSGINGGYPYLRALVP